jgi:hypothetical protein
MSKRIIGRYEDGSIKHCYFRKARHYRIKRNGFLPIRWRMYVAKSWQMDLQLTLQSLKTKKD